MLTWTRERPTVPGWYWTMHHQVADPSEGEVEGYVGEGTIVLLEWFNSAATVLSCRFMGNPELYAADLFDRNLWAGPIPPPTDPT